MVGAGGTVTVRPLSDQQAELAAITSVLGLAEPEERIGLAYAAMATYSRISLQPDGRMRLSPPLSLHLFPDEKRRVWVGAHEGTIMLCSERDWTMHVARTATALREAVAAAKTSV